jgi:hypothetical protein
MSLYHSAGGHDVNHASSSALDSFRFCRRKFRLSKIDGWREKDKKASLEFGKCVESAIQFYHENGLKPGEAVSEFERLWLKWSENKELVYTAQENNFFDLYTMGKEMLKLYEIMLPSLPIKSPKFQLQFSKPLWPGTNLGELTFLGYIDILSTLEDGSRVIIDVKTAKTALDATPGMLSMDGQLRKYAWVSGIRDVGFLNFVKSGHPDEFKKGASVTLLADTRDWKAGQELVVAKFVEPKPAIEPSEGVKATPEVLWLMWLGQEKDVQLIDEELKLIKGKGAEALKEQTVARYLGDGRLCSVDRDAVTKTRLQYIQTIIPEEEMSEVGQQIGDDMIAIKTAAETGRFPQDGGVRFPNAICSWCNFRGICLKDDKLRDELLIQIKPQKPEEDFLADLEETE